jgi:hypothetical protein
MRLSRFFAENPRAALPRGRESEEKCQGISHVTKQKAPQRALLRNFFALVQAGGTGSSPAARIRTPCAWQASLPIFGRRMRTHATSSLGSHSVRTGHQSKKHRECGALLW